MAHDDNEAASIEGADGTVPSDNVPNTDYAKGISIDNNYKKVPTSATYDNTATYYVKDDTKYTSATRYVVPTGADAITSENFATKVASPGLYLKK